MNFLSKVFSGGAADLVEGVGGVLDNLITSKDEKLEAKRKIKEFWWAQTLIGMIEYKGYFLKNIFISYLLFR